MVVEQLVTMASTIFGLDMMERWRWCFSLAFECEALEGCGGDIEFGFVMSASQQEGWTWSLTLIEVKKNERGWWDSLGGV